jgi:transposase-like protein
MSNTKTDAKPAKPGRSRKPKAEPAPEKPERCKWDPAFCFKVEALGAEGKSAPEIRRELGIPASTWRAWVKKHSEFAEAVEEAADQAEAWWIDLGRKGVMLGTAFSAQTFIYLTKNIFPARFRDRQDHQITGANDGPIVQELRAPDLMSIADPREALRQFEAFRSSLALAGTSTAATKH